MPYLRLNPYHGLSTYSTLENGPKFPFQEDEAVAMCFILLEPLAIPTASQTDEDLRGIDAKFEVPLRPKIDVDHLDYGSSQVESMTKKSHSVQLQFIFDTSLMLQAIITSDDDETQFPFQGDQVVKVPLIVKRVTRITQTRPTSPFTWRALLVPLGDEVKGLIVTEVELVEE